MKKTFFFNKQMNISLIYITHFDSIVFRIRVIVKRLEEKMFRKKTIATHSKNFIRQ